MTKLDISLSRSHAGSYSLDVYDYESSRIVAEIALSPAQVAKLVTGTQITVDADVRFPAAAEAD